MKTEFILGEERILDFEVKSQTGKALIISEANFILNNQGKVIQEGVCDIEGQHISCLVKPTERGCMYLEIKYVIAPETRKARIKIDVI